MKKIWITTLMTGILLQLLCGCRAPSAEKSPVLEEDPLSAGEKSVLEKGTPSDEEKPNSISFSCSHMERTRCFSYTLSARDPEQPVFSAWCFDEEENEISFENISISKDTWSDLLSLLEKSGVPAYLRDNPPKSPGSHVQDQTVYSVTLNYSGGSVLSSDRTGEFGDTLEQFFLDLAKRTK